MKKLFCLGIMTTVALLCGCAIPDNSTSLPIAQQLRCQASYVANGVTAADSFNAPAWKNAVEYPFLPAAVGVNTVCEGGSVKFLWNEEYIFIMATMHDSDLVQENNQDNQHHYQTGDVLEVFLKPLGQSGYWEIYATPNDRQTVFYYPSFARRLPSALRKERMPGLITKIELNGTLNNPTDRDQGWRAIIIIPFKSLQKDCPQAKPQSQWIVQVSRYNYSLYLDACELSQIGRTFTPAPNYHHFPSWAVLELSK